MVKKKKTVMKRCLMNLIAYQLPSVTRYMYCNFVAFFLNFFVSIIISIWNFGGRFIMLISTNFVGNFGNAEYRGYAQQLILKNKSTEVIKLNIFTVVMVIMV